MVSANLLLIAAVLGGLFYLLAPSWWDTPPAGAQDMGALLLRNVKLEHLTGTPYLGITYQELNGQAGEYPPVPGVAGALITSLAPGGPAAMAGLTTGDVILAIDAQTLSRETPLVKVLLDRRAGDRVRLLVQRSQDQVTIEVVLGKR